MRLFLVLAMSVACAAAADDSDVFTNEAAFMTAVAARGHNLVQESFEDNTAWAAARSPLTAASVTSNGIVWTSNHPNAVKKPGHITTGPGPARTGSWGVFAMPHGDPDATEPMAFTRDGFVGSAAPGTGTFFAVGGWFTGTFGGKVKLVLDGDEARVIELGRLAAGHTFYGFIDSRGFSRFEVREVEGKVEDMKLVFADDFTFGLGQAQTNQVTSVCAAGYRPGRPLAAGQIASAFGLDLAASIAGAATIPLPTMLADTVVKVRDSAGVERLAPLFYVSPGQINYLLPEGTANGSAVLTVARGDGHVVATGTLTVESVAPGLFAANADGRGVAAAVAIRVAADGSQTYEPVYACGASAGTCVAVPIDLGSAAEQVYVTLFGTGIRGRSSPSSVSARIGGVQAALSYSGAQGQFVGLDQIDVLLPRSLAGRGLVDVEVLIDGRTANVVTVNIR